MKKKKADLWFVYAVFGIGIIGGIVIGMLIQQIVFKVVLIDFGESLEGTTFNIDIDLNETELVDRFAEVFIPILNETSEVT